MNTLLSAYQTISQRSSALNKIIGQSIAWLTAVMVVLTAGIVIVRTAFNTGSVGAQELLTYLHAAVIMFASAYTLAEQEHVRVDIFYRRFSPRAKAWVDLLGSVLFLLPLALASCFLSWGFVSDAWAIRETSADAGGLPAVYLLKTLLLVNGGLLALQAIADICDQLSKLMTLDLESSTTKPSNTKPSSTKRVKA